MIAAPLIPRHAFINTCLGIIDACFYLSDEEQFVTISIIRKLCEDLNIPDRGAPVNLAAPLALEVSSSFYTERLAGPRDCETPRIPRVADERDLVVSVETWRQALVTIFHAAYPDLEPVELVHLTRTLDDLLTGLGVPHRAATHLPDDVIRAFGDLGA